MHFLESAFSRAENNSVINFSRRMESRELRDLMKKISATPNVFNTIFYSRQLNGYLEQHKILEIVSELMVLLALHRPPDVTTFMAENLPIIAENYRNNFVCLTFSNFLEQSNTIHRYAKLFKSPVIELKSSDKALDKLAELNDFLRRNSISGKNVILCSVLGEVCGRNFKVNVY